MDRRRLLLAAALFAGCGRAPDAEVAPEHPERTSTDLARLASVLDGIRKSRAVALYEGLPSEFWEPQLREQELSRKKTIRLHGYSFYSERLALRDPDAERLTALFLAKGSFKDHRGAKACGGYHPDYCLEWEAGEAATRGLICLECGEVKIYSTGTGLHCDLSPEATRRIKQWLSPYQRSRSSQEPRG